MGIRVAVDAMGGDNAPAAVVRGAIQAVLAEPDLSVTLVGVESLIRRELDLQGLNGSISRLSVHHASQVVGMGESPVEALKKKRDSSVVRMVDLAASHEVDAVVSAGNTGACAAVCQLKLRPLPCVSRPGIVVAIPSFHGPFVLCDVGANIQAKPRHLHDYAVMATLYAQRMLGIENPRVALISIGEERGKGTALIRQTHELLRADATLNFVGNAEGRELFEKRCDIGICDGFVGNIVLKFVEGFAEGMVRTLGEEFQAESPELRGRFQSALDRVWSRHDFSRYGGAPLLGVNGVCIICHGRSNALAVENAVRVARRFVEQDFNDAIVKRLSASGRGGSGG